MKFEDIRWLGWVGEIAIRLLTEGAEASARVYTGDIERTGMVRLEVTRDDGGHRVCHTVRVPHEMVTAHDTRGVLIALLGEYRAGIVLAEAPALRFLDGAG